MFSTITHRDTALNSIMGSLKIYHFRIFYKLKILAGCPRMISTSILPKIPPGIFFRIHSYLCISFKKNLMEFLQRFYQEFLQEFLMKFCKKNHLKTSSRVSSKIPSWDFSGIFFSKFIQGLLQKVVHVFLQTLPKHQECFQSFHPGAVL